MGERGEWVRYDQMFRRAIIVDVVTVIGKVVLSAKESGAYSMLSVER